MIWAFLQKMKQRMMVRKHMKELTGKTAEASREYDEYIELQLRRTLEKKNAQLPDRAKQFIDAIGSRLILSNLRILCVGCRNTAEINYFRSNGGANVGGVDLFSESPDIQVMDMHAMSFADDTFDLLYSSHSLEHSHDVKRAISEFIRVVKPGGTIAIEVPIKYETRGADLVDFKSLDELHRAFAPAVDTVIWSQQVDDKNKAVGTSRISTVFKVKK